MASQAPSLEGVEQLSQRKRARQMLPRADEPLL